MEQLGFWDELAVNFPSLKLHESTDWKWSFSDYPAKNGIKVFSCFACGGGSTMGYKLCGCEVLGDLEIDPHVNSVYVKNHHPKYNFVMDIREFNKCDDLPEELYHLDILDGSPPCTTFSMAGDREESWGVKKKFREGQAEQTLDDLSFHFIETAKKLQPKFVIMENVEGLLLGEAWQYVQRIYSEFDIAGYNVNHYLLKGESLGIPQTRHRVFFVAARKDLSFDYTSLDMNFNYKQVVYGEIKSGKGRSIKPGTELYRVIEHADEECKRLSDIYARLGEKERTFGTRICWDNNIMQTITANGMFYRGKERETVTNQDMIYAQTFPTDYDFDGQSVQYLLGMSVPPLMIKRLVTRLIDTGVFTNGN